MRFGIVGYGHVSHLITPITDDHTNSIRLLPYINPDLVNRQQGDLQTTLDYADNILEQEPGSNKFIVFISDGNFVSNDKIYNSKNTLHVVAIGTQTGAPYRLNTGQYAKNDDKLIFSKVNNKALKKLKGKTVDFYSITSPVYKYKFKFIKNKNIISNGVDNSYDYKIWHERYYLVLAVAAVGILIYITKGALLSFGLLVLILLFVVPNKSYADISDFVLSNDKRAEKLLNNGEFLKAGKLFTSNYNKGVAAYKAGNYILAEILFEPDKQNNNIDAIYNLANSQLKQLKLDDAIKNYEQVLSLNKNHADASFNLEIAKKLKQEQEQEQENKDQNSNQNQDNSNCDDCDKEHDQNQAENNDSGDNDNSNDELAKQDDEQQTQDKEPEIQEEQNQKQNQEQIANDNQISNKDDFENKMLGNIEGDLSILMRKKFIVEEYKYDQK